MVGAGQVIGGVVGPQPGEIAAQRLVGRCNGGTGGIGAKLRGHVSGDGKLRRHRVAIGCAGGAEQGDVVAGLLDLNANGRDSTVTAKGADRVESGDVEAAGVDRDAAGRAINSERAAGRRNIPGVVDTQAKHPAKVALDKRVGANRDAAVPRQGVVVVARADEERGVATC